MQQKTTEELIRLVSHGARLAAMGIVSPTKSDSTIGLGYEPGRRHQFALGEPGAKRALAGVAEGSGIAMVCRKRADLALGVSRLRQSLDHLISAQLSNEGNMQESNHKRRLVFELSKVEKR